MSVQDHVSSSMNESGTGEKIDTPLTQACSPSGLRALRNRTGGAESRRGRLLSNLDAQRRHLNDPDDRSWAQHPTHNLPWMMNVQVKALARGK